MPFDDSPIFRALAAEYAAGLGPPPGGRHRWLDEPPTGPIRMEPPVTTPEHTHVEVLPTTATMKRHVVHDERSRAFALPSRRQALRAVHWPRRGPVYDQGLLNDGEGLGCCTMCAGFGLMMTDPYAVPGRVFDLERDVVQGYREETRLDDREIPGQWEPDDTGSAGIYMAKVLKQKGLIGGYRHAFGLSATLVALQSGPLAIGTVWLESMNEPDHRGRLTVDPRSTVAGGHEYILDEYIPDDRVPGGGWVGKHGSWGTGWGLGGRAYMTVRDLDYLLGQDGDVIQFVRFMDGRR